MYIPACGGGSRPPPEPPRRFAEFRFGLAEDEEEVESEGSLELRSTAEIAEGGCCDVILPPCCDVAAIWEADVAAGFEVALWLL